METGRCGASGLCAARNVSTWGFGSVLHHLQGTGESTARAWARSRRTALTGFAFKVSNSGCWTGRGRVCPKCCCHPGKVARLPHTHVSRRTLLADTLLWKNRLFSEGCVWEVWSAQWNLSHGVCVAHTLLTNYQMTLKTPRYSKDTRVLQCAVVPTATLRFTKALVCRHPLPARQLAEHQREGSGCKRCLKSLCFL